MTRQFVDEMIRGMKLAGIVAKASAWGYEGFGDKQKSVRYVGLTLKDDWLTIFSHEDNLLLKFVIDRSSAYLEYYLANKPPFVKIFVNKFDNTNKWEHLLGEFRRRMKKDKIDTVNHRDGAGNLYRMIMSDLK